MDLHDTVRQVSGPKSIFWKFRDLDDTSEQI